ncbi:MAG: HipA domain-containing protein [Microthrixaceae bacterium]
MTSEPTTAFVWIWLPGASEPVVCGRLDDDGHAIQFTYGRSYLDLSNAVPIYEPELPLRRGPQQATDGIRLPLCIDDSMPDSWGRAVINHRLGEPTAQFGELTYLLNSGSDRIGTLDFQHSPDGYVARSGRHPSLEDLSTAAMKLQLGEPLSPELDEALAQGSSLGGARPKALLNNMGRQLIAKFSSTTDTFPVVQGEFVAMELAKRCSLNAAPVELRSAGGRYVLTVERFDRWPDGARRRIASALTVLRLSTSPGGRYATYVGLADAIRASFNEPDANLRELFSRIAFNILCGNTDDHGRNHAAFVDDMTLTPAYDICPQARGREARQAMAFTRAVEGTPALRDSRIELLVAAANEYHLEVRSAKEIVEGQVEVIRTNWGDVCDQAELTSEQRTAFMGTQFLNGYAFS